MYSVIAPASSYIRKLGTSFKNSNFNDTFNMSTAQGANFSLNQNNLW